MRWREFEFGWRVVGQDHIDRMWLLKHPGVLTTSSTRGLDLALWVMGCGVFPAACDLAYVYSVRVGIWWGEVLS